MDRVEMKLGIRAKKGFIFFISLSLGMLLCSCTPKPAKYPTSGEEIQSTLENSIQSNRALSHAHLPTPRRSRTVKEDLLPPLALEEPDAPEPPEHRFNVTANDMPAKNFFLGLVAGTKYNMMVSPTATGNITLNLKNVTIEQALEAARDMYGYQFKKTDMGYEILPQKMITQIFNINYLNINRTGQSQTQLVSTEITNLNTNNTGTGTTNTSAYSSPATTGTMGTQNTTQGSSSTIVTKAQNDFWTGLSTTLKTLVGNKENSWVVVNPQASVVMVHAYPKQIHEVSRYLQTIQKNLQREVIIEAKILEITLDDNYQAGVNWKILGAQQSGVNGLSTEFANDGQLFSLSINRKHDDFNSVINLLAQQGNIQVLSSPRISTINNQEAVIKVGSDQFFVTGYTSNVTPTTGSNTTSQSVALNPFFSGITLDVTPQISSAGGVTLYIHPSISEVKDQTKTIELGSGGGGTLTLPLALSTIRESDNVVHAQNGQIVVIGGLMQNNTKEVVAGTPGLSKVPMVGALARNTNQTSAKTELVILLRAIVVKNTKTWTSQLQETETGFQKVQRGFHAGGLPEYFGTEAEKNP